MLAQVQCHRLFAIYRALLTHSSLPILSSQSGVRGAVEHSRKGRRVQDSRFYPMHSPSLIVVNIDTVAWIMREAESDCGSRKSSHFLLSSHRLKKPSFLGYKKYVTLAVGSVSINYGVTWKDWTGMYLPRCRSFVSPDHPSSNDSSRGAGTAVAY